MLCIIQDGYGDNDVQIKWKEGTSPPIKTYSDIEMAQFRLVRIEHGNKTMLSNHGKIMRNVINDILVVEAVYCTKGRNVRLQFIFCFCKTSFLVVTKMSLLTLTFESNKVISVSSIIYADLCGSIKIKLLTLIQIMDQYRSLRIYADFV